MLIIEDARHEGGYRVRLRFGNGESHSVDLESVIRRYSAAKPLLDPQQFAAFYLDEWPTLAWPCGFDLAPETLYELATGRVPTWAGHSEVFAS